MTLTTNRLVPIFGFLALILAGGALAGDARGTGLRELPDRKHPSVDDDAHRLAAQELPVGWTLQTIDLYYGNVIPQFAPAGDARARFAINERTGEFRVRITTNRIRDAIGAHIRAAVPGRNDHTLVELEQSFQSMLVWGSADINNECVDIRLSPADLELFLSGRVYLSLDALSDLDGPRRGGLLPSASPFSFVGGRQVSPEHQPAFIDDQIRAFRADRRIAK